MRASLRRVMRILVERSLEPGIPWRVFPQPARERGARPEDGESERGAPAIHELAWLIDVGAVGEDELDDLGVALLAGGVKRRPSVGPRGRGQGETSPVLH